MQKAFELWKQVMSMGAAEARRKGLVPKSGNWEHPGRWVRSRTPGFEGQKATPFDTMSDKELSEHRSILRSEVGRMNDWLEDPDNKLDPIRSKVREERTRIGKLLSAAALENNKRLVQRDIEYRNREQ